MKRTNEGFTIIEILIVLGIAGIMAAVAIGTIKNGSVSLSKAVPISDSGVSKVSADVKIGPDGLTSEQRNIKNKAELENRPGSIKHLYVISPYSGQVVIYSTIDEKTTSSGKRLTPYKVVASGSDLADQDGIPITIGGKKYHTDEVLQHDGTYGSSIPYLYWWDVQGRYHKHYVSGGQIIHISDQPLPVKNITINMELAATE